ncbi:hypothetical protein niasHT_003982 [Heterodera trifolii]|uniref:Uncharacterized protein n=1 Tax=Heterodera trifolii TaxID=157864 RepID=A0ABD2M538_9BILA
MKGGGDIVFNQTSCNEPLPTEPSTQTEETPIEVKPVNPLEAYRDKPYVAVLDVGNCTEIVRELCPCKIGFCVRRDGYSRTNCCPPDYDLVCCATKAKAIDEIQADNKTMELLKKATGEPVFSDFTEFTTPSSALGKQGIYWTVMSFLGIDVFRPNWQQNICETFKPNLEHQAKRHIQAKDWHCVEVKTRQIWHKIYAHNSDQQSDQRVQLEQCQKQGIQREQHITTVVKLSGIY